MWAHYQQELREGREPSGAELDRAAGTNNHGRAVLARWRRIGRVSSAPGAAPNRVEAGAIPHARLRTIRRRAGRRRLEERILSRRLRLAAEGFLDRPLRLGGRIRPLGGGTGECCAFVAVTGRRGNMAFDVR